MIASPELFDIALAITLVALAWHLLRAADLFTGIVLFILFGLLTALAWVRLGAPDIALAEAAIGAGLTGALFLGALGRMEAPGASGIESGERDGGGVSRRSQVLLICPLAGVAAVLFWSVASLPAMTAGLRDYVEAALPRTGVENRVTAVILNFRGYDTLLEIGVLLLAAISVFALSNTDQTGHSRVMLPMGRILTAFVHILAPVMIVVAGYFLWVGAHAPGGAFQAGAVLAAVGVLLLLTGTRVSFLVDEPSRRWASTVGFLLFLLVGLGTMVTGRNFLEYPPGSAKHLILIIETAATLSIAYILTVLFAGCAALLRRGQPGGGPSEEPEP